MKVNLSAFLQWRINVYLFRKLDWTSVYLYIGLLVKLYFFVKRSEKWKIINALATVFSDRKNDLEMRSLAEKTFGGILAHYYEKIFNAFSEAETLKAFFHTHVKSEGMSALDEGLSRGKGVLLITGHLGAVEYIPTFLGSNNYPVAIVAKFSSQRLRRESLQKADKYGARIIDAGKTPNVIKAIQTNLKENRIVIIQCDEIEEWRPSRKDKIFFLGKRTFLDRTLNVLYKRTTASVVFGFMHRESVQRYKFVATSMEAMSRQFQRSVDTPLGAVILKFLERYIYLYPEEWYQWKKYAQIKAVPSGIIADQASDMLPVLEPSLGHAS